MNREKVYVCHVLFIPSPPPPVKTSFRSVGSARKSRKNVCLSRFCGFPSCPLPHIFRPPHCPLRSCSQDSSSIHFIHLPPKQTTAFHINWLGLVPFPKTSNPFHLRKTRKKWSLIIVTNSFTMLSRRFRNSLNTDIRALNPWIGRSATLNEFDWGITLCTMKKPLVKPSYWAWTQFCQAQM